MGCNTHDEDAANEEVGGLVPTHEPRKRRSASEERGLAILAIRLAGGGSMGNDRTYSGRGSTFGVRNRMINFYINRSIYKYIFV